MYSAGAASADLFKERGVLAALGFKAGVSVSSEETIALITQQWEDGTGKMVGAIDGLADTWTGRMSMMGDAFFKFSSAVGEFLIDNPAIQAGIENITENFKKMADALGGESELEHVQEQIEC